jgi:hypothetical protein
MTNIRTLAASLALLAAATPAFAGQGPRLIGGGENARVVYDDDARGNVAGGGRAIVRNDVEPGFRVTYLEIPPVTGIGVARLTGGGENTMVAYGPPAPSATAGILAQRR